MKVSYAGFERVSDQPQSYYDTLWKSGCAALFFGVESGSNRILNDIMGKNTNKEQIRNSIRLCKKAGIFSVVGIIYPAPKETEESTQETLALLKELKPDSVLVGNPFLIPGTEWSNNHSKYGFNIQNPEKFIQDSMNYRVKFTYPPYLWDPLPYTLEGMSDLELHKKTQEFVDSLKTNGIPVGILDEMALVAKYLNMSLKDFGEMTCRIFQTGDVPSLEKLVKKVNKGGEAHESCGRISGKEDPYTRKETGCIEIS